jgi:hypothetical protein
MDGYYLKAPNSCLSCGLGEKTCEFKDNKWEVTACRDGFYLTERSCEECGTGAKECDATKAITCMDGYYLKGNECAKLPTGCKASSSAGVICDTCETGYFNEDVISKCHALTANCNKGDSNGCTECEKDHRLNQDKSCIKSVAGCLKVQENSGVCQECDHENSWYATGVFKPLGSSEISMNCFKKESSASLRALQLIALLPILLLIF